jgi:hypothetical protein
MVATHLKKYHGKGLEFMTSFCNAMGQGGIPEPHEALPVQV